METDATGDNSTLHHVDIHCSLNQVTWGNLNVKKVTAPGKVTVKSAKAKGKKATIKWATVKGAAGYQIQYSTSKKFKDSKIVATKKTSVTIKNLKKKTYYVKVKAYKLDRKKEVYGKWSKVKRFRV